MIEIDLNVLADRIDGLRQAVIGLTNKVDQVADAVQKSDVSRATEFERLTARSDTNKASIAELRKDVDRNRGVLTDNDQQQVQMIYDEEAARIKADDAVEKKLEVLPAILLTNRIIIALASATVLSIIGGVLSGHISLVVHP